MTRSTVTISFHADETHLLEIGTRFRDTGRLEEDEFNELLKWKFRTSMAAHRKRMLMLAGTDSFKAALFQFATSLRRARSNRARLMVMTQGWGFPHYAALLLQALLYPSVTTHYELFS